MRRSTPYEGDLEVLPAEWPDDDTAVGPSIRAHASSRSEEPIERGADVFVSAAQVVTRVSGACVQAAAPVHRAYERYSVAIGAHRGYRPRQQSHVQHRIGRAVGDVLRAIGAGDIARSGRDAELQLVEPAAETDRGAHEYRIAGRLHIRWSFPDLPVWLTVSAWSREDCVLDLELRSRRRLRYPLRYYHAGHRVLDALGDRIEARLG